MRGAPARPGSAKCACSDTAHLCQFDPFSATRLRGPAVAFLDPNRPFLAIREVSPLTCNVSGCRPCNTVLHRGSGSKKVRICGIRVILGWRHAEQEQVYDLAVWCDGDVTVDGIRPSHQKVARAEYYRSIYATQAAVRLASKERVYAWRARKRAEREARREAARQAHIAAIVVANAAGVAAYVQGEKGEGTARANNEAAVDAVAIDRAFRRARGACAGRGKTCGDGGRRASGRTPPRDQVSHRGAFEIIPAAAKQDREEEETVTGAPGGFFGYVR